MFVGPLQGSVELLFGAGVQLPLHMKVLGRLESICMTNGEKFGLQGVNHILSWNEGPLVVIGITTAGYINARSASSEFVIMIGD